MEMQTQVQPQARQVVKSVRQQVQDAFGSVEMQAALSVVPPWIDRQEFAAQAAADAADPALASVPLPELVRGYLTIARMGMMPGPCKHVARVPRGQTLDVQAQWQGVQYVLRQGGWAVSAHIVLHDDRLELATIGPDEFDVLRHDYADPFARVVTKANLRGAYAKGVNLRTNETIYRMVPLERIERANKAAKTQAIWNSDFAAMVSKTVFHQAASRRWFPLAADVQAALAMAEELDFDPQPKERKPLSIGVAAAPLRLVQEVQPEPEQLVLTADQCSQGDEVQP
jgi:recombinational DNA repair protein RecT